MTDYFHGPPAVCLMLQESIQVNGCLLKIAVVALGEVGGKGLWTTLQGRYCQPKIGRHILAPFPEPDALRIRRRPSQGGIARVDGISMDWRHNASCRDVDPEIFFPIGTTGPALAQIEAAKAICGMCAVREPCLEWAIETAQDAGVWGGTTEEERRMLRRGRATRQRVAV